jgi:hypothetical protein
MTVEIGQSRPEKIEHGEVAMTGGVRLGGVLRHGRVGRTDPHLSGFAVGGKAGHRHRRMGTQLRVYRPRRRHAGPSPGADRVTVPCPLLGSLFDSFGQSPPASAAAALRGCRKERKKSKKAAPMLARIAPLRVLRVSISPVSFQRVPTRWRPSGTRDLWRPSGTRDLWGNRRPVVALVPRAPPANRCYASGVGVPPHSGTRHSAAPFSAAPFFRLFSFLSANPLLHPQPQP